jgi:pimeloyl-[acyl-carrier protein] methyl ester esterase
MTAIVLLHGWGMRPAVFDGLATILSPRHTVHPLPLPGYDGAPATSAYALDEVAAAVAARAPGKCAVAGWSLGAQVALAWARARPQQIGRLVLVSATPCFVQRDDWPAAMPPAVFDAFADLVRTDAAAALRRFIALQAQGDAAAGQVARTLGAALEGPSPRAHALENGLRILRETDLRGTLDAIETRTLLIHGERDRLVPTGAAEYLAAALPHASLERVPYAAHAPFVSDPRDVGRRMLEFLG